jgi:hypothetical protein
MINAPKPLGKPVSVVERWFVIRLTGWETQKWRGTKSQTWH